MSKTTPSQKRSFNRLMLFCSLICCFLMATAIFSPALADVLGAQDVSNTDLSTSDTEITADASQDGAPVTDTTVTDPAATDPAAADPADDTTVTDPAADDPTTADTAEADTAVSDPAADDVTATDPYDGIILAAATYPGAVPIDPPAGAHFPYDTSVGGFVFESDNIFGENFYGQPSADDPAKALVTMNNVSINNLRIFKNMTCTVFEGTEYAETYNYSMTITSSNLDYSVYIPDTALITSEMYAKNIVDPPGVFPPDYWTTEPENDLPQRLGNQPAEMFFGSKIKFNGHRFSASSASFNNFVLAMEPVLQTSVIE